MGLSESNLSRPWRARLIPVNGFHKDGVLPWRRSLLRLVSVATPAHIRRRMAALLISTLSTTNLLPRLANEHTLRLRKVPLFNKMDILILVLASKFLGL